MRFESKLDELVKNYEEKRLDPTVTDPVEVGHALKENRILRAAVEKFATDLREDEHVLLRTFQNLTCDTISRPSRFDPIPPQTTMFESVKRFVRENRGVEFRALDVAEACGFMEKQHILTVRTFLRRLIDDGKVKRLRTGVYRAKKKKKPALIEDSGSPSSV